MPFWMSAVLSGLFFCLGLLGLAETRRTARIMGTVLMLHASLLLFVAAARDLGGLEGQAIALILLGLLPVGYTLGLVLWREGRGEADST